MEDDGKVCKLHPINIAGFFLVFYKASDQRSGQLKAKHRGYLSRKSNHGRPHGEHILAIIPDGRQTMPVWLESTTSTLVKC